MAIDLDWKGADRLLKQVLQILPREAAQALDGLNAAQVEEIRLRCGQVPSILRRGVEQPLPHCERTPQQELQRTLLAASAQSQYAVQEQLREGFLSVPGGVRIGVCGSAVVQDGRVTGIREISSLCIRIPHEIRHPPEQLLPLLSASCLLAGRPGSGKTTLLRSCIRALSAAGSRVGVVDERLELAGAVHGVPQFDLGPHTDVLSGCPKAAGMQMLLRGMNPEWLAVDEITSPADLAGIRQAFGCGVRILATIHAGSAAELREKPLCRAVLGAGMFEQVLFLDNNRAFHAERIRYAETDRTEFDPHSLERDGPWPGQDRPAQQAQTLAFIDAVLRIRHELQYRLTPLPDVFLALQESREAAVAAFFSGLAGSLSAADTCTVGYACRQALRRTEGLCIPAGVRTALMSLFDTLGKYDLDGNLQALDLALGRLREEARQLQGSAAARCKTYVTLGVCTGLAVAVILI